MPTPVAYHLDAAATPQPQPVPPELAAFCPPQPRGSADAERLLVRDLAALAGGAAAGPLQIEVARHGPQVAVTLRRAGLSIALPRVEPIVRAHGVALASAHSADGVVTLSLLVPGAAAVRG